MDAYNLPRPVILPIAVCKVCREAGKQGVMREHEDKGVFGKAPFGRLWIYECDNCGRKVQFCAPTSPLETAIKVFGEQIALQGVQ